LEVARGAKQADVARKHGFSVSNFRRWFVKYGRPHIPYEPTEADRARLATWREGRTLSSAWTLYQELAQEGRWADDAELPTFDDANEQPDEHEYLRLKTRPDARVVLVCEKVDDGLTGSVEASP
jgi:transposase-like protein